MKDASTLVVIDRETPDSTIHEFAEAASTDQSHLSFLLLGPIPALPVYAYGVPPYAGKNIPDNWSDIVSEAQDEHDTRANEIERLMAQSGVSGQIRAVLCPASEIRVFVAQQARACDVAYLAPNLRDAPRIMREAAHGILFQSPIGMMLNAPPFVPKKRIFVAWDSSKACARAVHTALPYLKAADDITIGCFDPIVAADQQGAEPGADVAAWLSHHGCKVTVTQYPSGGREIGQCIHERATEVGADLVVMGAYGHSRLIEAVFGGTTETMIRQTELPVLLAH